MDLMKIDTSIFSGNGDRNQSKLVLICLKCCQFPKISKIKLLNEKIMIDSICNCKKKVFLLDEYFNTYRKKVISYSTVQNLSTFKYKLAILNSEHKQENIEIILPLNENQNDNKCECANIKEFYCNDCNYYLCRKCMDDQHREHIYLPYTDKNFLSEKDFEIFQINGKNRMKDITMTLKNYIKHFETKYFYKTQKIQKLKSHFKFNTNINKKLFYLFHLLIQTFTFTKPFQIKTNYQNLCFFNKLNYPYNLSQHFFNCRRGYWTFYKKNFYFYCNTQFLINIDVPLSHQGYLHLLPINIIDFDEKILRMIPIKLKDFILFYGGNRRIFKKIYISQYEWNYDYVDLPSFKRDHSFNIVRKISNDEIIVSELRGISIYSNILINPQRKYYPFLDKEERIIDIRVLDRNNKFAVALKRKVNFI